MRFVNGDQLTGSGLAEIKHAQGGISVYAVLTKYAFQKIGNIFLGIQILVLLRGVLGPVCISPLGLPVVPQRPAFLSGSISLY